MIHPNLQANNLFIHMIYVRLCVVQSFSKIQTNDAIQRYKFQTLNNKQVFQQVIRGVELSFHGSIVPLISCTNNLIVLYNYNLFASLKNIFNFTSTTFVFC